MVKSLVTAGSELDLTVKPRCPQNKPAHALLPPKILFARQHLRGGPAPAAGPACAGHRPVQRCRPRPEHLTHHHS